MKYSAAVAVAEQEMAIPYYYSLRHDLNSSERNYFQSYINLYDNATIFVRSGDVNDRLPDINIQHLVAVNRLNAIPKLNDFITNVNQAIPEGGVFACQFHSEEARIKEMRRAHAGRWKFYLAYAMDYLKRKWRSFVPAKKRNGAQQGPAEAHPLALAETLGRISAGGFEIVDYQSIDGMVHVVARKTSAPSFSPDESDGLIFKMKRIGKGGKVTEFYKFRTMHVYAEYLQKFLYSHNGLINGDKFKNDFRVTRIGNFLRKYWLDELPMIINFLKGDLKLVGVRPLSNQKFNLYTTYLQQYRTNFKPGLIPPFYSDMPRSFDELMGSEMRYLRSYERAPLKTDIKYFFRAVYNIFVKGARSL